MRSWRLAFAILVFGLSFPPTASFAGPKTRSGADLKIENYPVIFDFSDKKTGKLTGKKGVVRQKKRVDQSTVDLMQRRFANSTVGATLVWGTGNPTNRFNLVFIGDGYTTADLPIYVNQVNAITNYIFSLSPLKEYANYFNVFRVDLVSTVSGISGDPTISVVKTTPLSMTFGCDGIDRALCVDIQKSFNAAQAAPGVTQIIALANTSKYGGSAYTGIYLVTSAGGNKDTPEIMAHELGHSVGNLGDEYDYGGPTQHSSTEIPYNNSTVFDRATMLAKSTKWYRWLGVDLGSGFDGVVGSFEGSDYSLTGAFRPSKDSKMRELYHPYNLPSIESLIYGFYQKVRPLDSATSTETSLSSSTLISIQTQSPSQPLSIYWAIDGVDVPAARGKTNFKADDYSILTGTHSVSVKVVDENRLFLNDLWRNQYLTDTRKWTVIGAGANHAPIFQPILNQTVNENQLLSFSVNASDSDSGDILSYTASGVPEGAVFFRSSHTFSWIPTFTQAGSYTVAFAVSDGRGGSDSKSVIISVTNVPTPDLSIMTVTGPTNASPGNSVSVSAAVLNSGDGRAGSFALNFYLSPDIKITSSDTLLGTLTIASFEPAASATSSTSLLIPAGLVSGTYYIGAIVDPAQSISEIDESNNTRLGNSILLSSKIPAPTGLTPLPGAVFLSTTTSVPISWQAVSGASGYLLRAQDLNDSSLRDSRNTWNGYSYLYIDRYTGTNIVLGVKPGHAYTFWVHAMSPTYSAADSSTYSDPSRTNFSVSAVVVVPTQIAPPVILSPSAGTVYPSSKSTVTVSWTPVSDAVGYMIRIQDLTDTTLRDPRNTYSSMYVYIDNYKGTSIDIPVKAGHSYKYWMHSMRADFSYANQLSWSVSAPTNWSVGP